MIHLIEPGVRGNKYWLARGRLDGQLIELSTGTLDRDEAERFAKAVKPRPVNDRPAGRYTDPRLAHGRWGVSALSGARDRAKLRGVPFELTTADLELMIRRAAGRCEVSGIPFSDFMYEGVRRKPFTPSIDRIRPAAGYVAANCRLVAFAVNVAMSDWGEIVLREIVFHMKNVGSGGEKI